VSITRRILESAQSGLNRLTSLVIVDDDPLSYVESAALQTELTARKAAREKAVRKPQDNPLAKLAMPNPAARAQRDKASRERGARVHKERDDREAKQRAAADEAFRKMKEQAARGGPMPGSWSSTSSSSTGSTSSSSGPRPPRPGSQDALVAEWYRQLDVQPGDDMATIKSSYRKLMRKYHPDMHAGNPQRQKAATELSMRVTAAYNGLVAHLEKTQ
jgi:DnaJ-domain-containing protein 1